MRITTLVLLVMCNLFLPSLWQSAIAASGVPVATAETQLAQQVASQTLQKNQYLNDQQKSSIVPFYTWSVALHKDLMALNTSINVQEIDTLLREELPQLTANIQDLQSDITTGAYDSYMQKMKLSDFRRELSKLSAQLKRFDKTLTDTFSHFSYWRNDWIANKEKLARFTEQQELATVLDIAKKRELSQIIDDAVHLIDTHLGPALVMGNELTNLQIRLETIDTDLREIDKRIIASRIQRTSPTLLSTDFYKQLSLEMLIETYTNAKRFFVTHYQSLKENIHNAVVGGFLFFILYGCIYFTKNLVTPSSRWYPFASSPFATAVFLISAILDLINRWVDLAFANRWNDIISIMAIVAVIRLVKNHVDDKWKQKILTGVALFTAIIMLLALLELPQLFILFFVFSTSVVAFTLYLYTLRINSKYRLVGITYKSWGILPAIVILSSLAGYDHFAIFFFVTLITSVSICLLIWMLFHLTCGLLELLLNTIPLSLLRDNFSVIVKSLQPPIALFYILLAGSALLVAWDIYPSVDLAWQSIRNLGFDIGVLHISLVFLLSIYVVFYGALLFSSAIQALLLQKILPHYKAGKGAQISIARLVHYAILTIGFFVMLKVLGFELKQLTILGGALGVGIGFGLQAIVNNFVSGLILLFERPIKVGDTIQVGTELGEVKNLGLRATIIQTFDNSEIVIPNADLVTGQVTNWTLAERMVRVKIPVGVAYGTNVEKVLEILKECANSHPMVLSTPKPQALFRAFGGSSLDFELRFWIPEFLDKFIATSELNQSIESEFALNNIEIPFMQTDLHIRSVDAEAAVELSGKKLPTE